MEERKGFDFQVIFCTITLVSPIIIFLLALAGIIPVASHVVNSEMLLCIIILVSGYLFFITIDARDLWIYRCHYCKKRIYKLQNSIMVSWSEPTMYFKKKTQIEVRMHVKCHKTAGNAKFKIPNPEFNSFII